MQKSTKRRERSRLITWWRTILNRKWSLSWRSMRCEQVWRRCGSWLGVSLCWTCTHTSTARCSSSRRTCATLGLCRFTTGTRSLTDSLPATCLRTQFFSCSGRLRGIGTARCSTRKTERGVERTQSIFWGSQSHFKTQWHPLFAKRTILLLYRMTRASVTSTRPLTRPRTALTRCLGKCRSTARSAAIGFD